MQRIDFSEAIRATLDQKMNEQISTAVIELTAGWESERQRMNDQKDLELLQIRTLLESEQRAKLKISLDRDAMCDIFQQRIRELESQNGDDCGDSCVYSCCNDLRELDGARWIVEQQEAEIVQARQVAEQQKTRIAEAHREVEQAKVEVAEARQVITQQMAEIMRLREENEGMRTEHALEIGLLNQELSEALDCTICHVKTEGPVKSK